jgi:hypothetical protein
MLVYQRVLGIPGKLLGLKHQSSGYIISSENTGRSWENIMEDIGK